jgi:hypothetical protein
MRRDSRLLADEDAVGVDERVAGGEYAGGRVA